MKAQEPGHILIIEDEQSTADQYTELLRDRYIVSKVTSGEDALTKFNDSIDIVILNRNRSECADTAFVQKLRDCGFDGGVVILVETEPRINIRSLGVDESLVTPVSRSEVVNAVERLRQLESYDVLLQEHYSAISKLTALQTTNSGIDLSEDERYTDLCKRIGSLEDDLDKIEGELTGMDYHAAFRAVVE